MKVNKNAGSRGILVQVFQLNVTEYKNVKEESRNGKGGKKEQYLDSKGMHKASMVELIIVNSSLSWLTLATPRLHRAYSAANIESGASMNSDGSIGTCGASSPTNW